MATEAQNKFNNNMRTKSDYQKKQARLMKWQQQKRIYEQVTEINKVNVFTKR